MTAVMQSTRSLRPSIALADVFSTDAVVVALEQGTKQGAVVDLVHQLVALRHVSPEREESIVGSIMAREQHLGATGFNGIAYPHCCSSVVDKLTGAIGLNAPGLPFDAVDGDPIYAIFLLLAPIERRDQLYEVLGRLTAIGRDKTLRLQLRSCKTPQAVHDFLQCVDRQ